MHRWNYTYADHPRQGSTLVRDCVQCGVEELRGAEKRMRRWVRNGVEVKIGMCPPPCEAAEPMYTIVVSSERWVVRKRRGRGGDSIVAAGACATVGEGIEAAVKAVKP
jgi:hypothetical protein